MVRPIVFRGAKEIGLAVGVGEKEIPTYVEKHGMPAWQRKENGIWYALPSDLEDWIQKQRDKYLRRDNK